MGADALKKTIAYNQLGIENNHFWVFA